MDRRPHRSAASGIARSASLVSVAVMCSRVLGLIREQVFATLFGAGLAYDAFVVAYRIPNLLRDLFGEGALSAAFVTVFTEYDSKRGARATWTLAANVLTVVGTLVALLCLLAMAAAPAIVHVLAPGFAVVPGKTELTVTMTRIMMPYLLFVSLAAVAMGMLNSKGFFFLPSLASSFFNLGSIIGGTSLALFFRHLGQPGILGMACGTLLGGALQFLVQLPPLRKSGFRYRLVFRPLDPGVRRVFRLMLPATIGLSATQLTLFVNTNFAASCGDGAVSWLTYAFRLVHLPTGMFGVAFSVAALPVLARQAALQDRSGFRETLASSLVMVTSLTVPATVGLMLLSAPIIRMIFEHGAFTAHDTAMTAQALQMYALGLIAYTGVKVLVPVFYAIDSPRYPVIGSFLSVALNVLVILATIGPLQHRAIALATSATMSGNMLFLAWILHRKLGGLPLARLGVALAKILLAAAGMGATLVAARRALAPWLNGSVAQEIAAVGALVILGAATYLAAVLLLRVPEPLEIAARLRQRLLRR